VSTGSASEALLVVSIGACAFLAVLQLWMGLRSEGPSRWAGAWATFAVIFAGARLAQLNATDAGSAVFAARLYCACSPLLLWSLCRLVGSVTDAHWTRMKLRVASAATLATSAAMLSTDWFVGGRVEPSVSLSGDLYLGVPGGPALPLLGVLVAAALAWSFGQLSRSRDIAPRERRLLFGTLAVYAAMGASSIASALHWIPGAGVAEYGPLFVSLAAGHILAIRRRRLEASLSHAIAQRASALRESERLYGDVLDNAPVGFLSIDAGGRLERANPKLLAMLGLTEAEFAAGFDVMNEANARGSGFSEMLERALQTGEKMASDFEFTTWWGRRLATRTSVAPHRDASGSVVGALAIVEDNTARRAIERELQRSQRMEAVGQLAAGIAHEINNPMAYVRSNLSVLGEDLEAIAKDLRSPDAPDVALSCLAALEEQRVRSLDSVQRTVGIVRDLREFSRTSRAEREPTDVNALLENAVRLAAARQHGGRIGGVSLGDLPEIQAVPGQLQQVFLNLLLHARQAVGPSGRVTASTELAGDEIRVTVHDDGPPIPPEARARLFDPFVAGRGESEPSLGLYMSEQIAREHGGGIEVRSDERGTAFAVRLPVAER
jgi:PAS domain S-box-containing protein